ncbi:hypothetical protein KBB60_01730 [Patescibacteria group bacterium]|nr:hypothetical protein [Patescibacteria group bacterium]
MADSRDKEIIGAHKQHDFDAKSFFGDGKEKHRFGCTCATLFLFCVIVLALLVVVVFFAGRSSLPLPRSNVSSSAVNSSSKAQVMAALNSESDNVTVTLNEQEINATLPRNYEVSITPDGMWLKGEMIGMSVLALLEPEVADGSLDFTVKDVKMGTLPAMRIVAAPVVGRFSRGISSINKELLVINLTSVAKSSGALVLQGKVVGR